MTVPSIGTFQYAGVTFPTETYTEISARPNYDESGRTVTHVTSTIVAKAKLTAACLIQFLDPSINNISGYPMDDIMSVIQTRLSTPGSALVFEGRGYASLTCNGTAEDDNGNPVLDVDFGPKPKITRWTPIGVTAAEITWECEVNLPVCSGLAYQGVLLSLTFTQDFSVDHVGHCSRTTTGTITIPMTRTQDGSLLGPPTLPDTADNYWNDVFVLFITPYWCRRTTNQRYLNYAKNVLRFRLVDTQMGQNMLPPNVVDMQASQSVTQLKKPGQQSIIGTYLLTFNATITMGRGVARSGVYQVFLDWVIERINFSLGAGYTVLPVSLSLEEPDVFGNGPTGRFSLAFIMLQPLTDETASTWLTGTSMWLPSGNEWEDWMTSMIATNQVNTPFGSAGLRAINTDDELVTVCNQPSGLYGGTYTYIDVPFGPETARFPVLKPSPESSWVTFSNALSMLSDPGTLLHKLLPDSMVRGTPVADSTPYDSRTTGTSVSSLAGNVTGADNTDIVQSLKSPTTWFKLIGKGMRVSYNVPMPTLVSMKGQVIQPTGTPKYASEQIGNFGYPITAASWEIEYNIPYSDSVGSYVCITPDSPLPGQDVNDIDDTNDDLQGDGIDDEGESVNIYEDE